MQGFSCAQCDQFYAAIQSWQQQQQQQGRERGRCEHPVGNGGRGAEGGREGFQPPERPACGHQQAHEQHRRKQLQLSATGGVTMATNKTVSASGGVTMATNNTVSASKAAPLLLPDGGCQDASRHRGRFGPLPMTPPGFWNLGFPGEEEEDI